jgi:hypothetical protein
MHRHIIVSGDDALATTIVDELNSAGTSIVKLATDELADADLAHASAVICAGDDDARNLEIALLARKANPNVRVVARLANDVLREAMAADNGPGAILDVADLAAPSVVEACLARTAHPFYAAGIKFVVWRTEAPRDATLREIYGDLAPVAVIHGKNSSTPGEVVTCPGRDLRVHAGDWTALIGTADELAARGIKVPRPTATRSRLLRLRQVSDAARTLRNDINPMFYRAFRHADPADRVNGRVALQLPAPAGDDVARRVVLHHRDDRDGGLRRLQLRVPAYLAASVQHHADVRRRNDHRDPCRFHRRPATVAPLYPLGGSPAGAPSAQPRRRRRAGFVRHPRGQ